MLFIGDVHGKYGPYRRLMLSAGAPTIQVGDMGVGFQKLLHGEVVGEKNPPHYAMERGRHRFIRGNHDNPKVCRRHSQFIQDGTIEGPIMFLGGAQSVDAALRTEGLDFWVDEELSYKELYGLTGVYTDKKPEVMVTHDCPEEVAEALAAHTGRCKLHLQSRTRMALQSMWSAHSPKLWVFGHWHGSFDCVLRGTRFVCLDELEMRNLTW